MDAFTEVLFSFMHDARPSSHLYITAILCVSAISQEMVECLYGLLYYSNTRIAHAFCMYRQYSIWCLPGVSPSTLPKSPLLSIQCLDCIVAEGEH